jgi:hypothetical protein
VVSHAEFLRQQWGEPDDDVVQLVRALVDAGERAAQVPLEQGVQLAQLRVDELMPRLVAAQPGDHEVLRFVIRAALAPRSLDRTRLQPLRAAGFDDRAIHDIVNVVCCFSYMNRLADSLGVGTVRDEWATRLFGEERVKEHHAWAAYAGS